MRMMLEVPKDLSFGVLSPAFLGCEGNFALKDYANRGCCFLSGGLCQLHGTGFMPLECRFCHHDRGGRVKCAMMPLKKIGIHHWDSNWCKNGLR